MSAVEKLTLIVGFVSCVGPLIGSILAVVATHEQARWALQELLYDVKSRDEGLADIIASRASGRILHSRWGWKQLLLLEQRLKSDYPETWRRYEQSWRLWRSWDRLQEAAALAVAGSAAGTMLWTIALISELA